MATKRSLTILLTGSVAVFSCLAIHAYGGASRSPGAAGEVNPQTPVTFYRDVAPILQDHCEVCHRSEGIAAPMPLQTYVQTRENAAAIRRTVTDKSMPPWFAEPSFGPFSNDPSLTARQIAAIAVWVQQGAPAGDAKDAPPPKKWAGSWTIPQPDDVVEMPEEVSIPTDGEVGYTYEIAPTHFIKDEWVRMVEILPGLRGNVHHAVVYVRPPGSQWLQHAPIGKPFTAETLSDPQDRRGAHWTNSDVLLVYAPGSSPDEWPENMAKFIPAGSDLVFQMHYTTNRHAGKDRTRVGLVFAKTPPPMRVLTLQLTNDRFVIPPGDPNYRVEVHGTLPNDALLLSFFPHMHLRGKRFEYNIVNPQAAENGRTDTGSKTLLRVDYHFHWQMSYKLAQPIPLKAGTMLQAVAWFDNSKDNPHNPDPEAAVRWGEQTSDEMMVGFFDVAVAAGLDKQEYFLRH